MDAAQEGLVSVLHATLAASHPMCTTRLSVGWCPETHTGLKKRVDFVRSAAWASSASERLVNQSKVGTEGTYQAVANVDSHEMCSL